MFTGIIQDIGTIQHIENQNGDSQFVINSPHLDLTTCVIGDSIAVNGVCLTIVTIDRNRFHADVSRETLTLTTLSAMQSGAKVNLELALTLNKPLGGHLVSGHVDGIGKIIDRKDDGRSLRLRIQVPESLTRYIAQKGSICVDGVSLTVNTLTGSIITLNIVPHTQSKTIIKTYHPGTAVNIEVDLIARYLERLMQQSADKSCPATTISQDFLLQHGFVNA
jgi:riboflavin synthase